MQIFENIGNLLTKLHIWNLFKIIKKLENMWFKITFWKHVMETDDFTSSRIQDLHEAFADKNLKAISSVIWGYNSNQLLDYIDYDLIKNNPKFCSFCCFVLIWQIRKFLYSFLGFFINKIGLAN